MHEKNHNHQSIRAVIVAKYKQNWYFGNQLLFQALSLGSYFPGKINPSFPGSRSECDLILVQGEACTLLYPVTL